MNEEDEDKSQHMHTTPSSSLLQSLLPPLPPENKNQTTVRIYLLRHGETDWNRQGKIQGGGYDIPLNDNGRRQAIKAAQELDGLPLSIIASSSLRRAQETADILWERHTAANAANSDTQNNNNNHNKTPPPKRIVDAGFNEMRFGEFEGFRYKGGSSGSGGDKEKEDTSTTAAPQEEFLKYFQSVSKKTKEDIHFPFPGGSGESTFQVKERSVTALERLLEKVKDADSDNNNSANNNNNHHHHHIAVVSHGRANKILIAATALGDVRRSAEVQQSNTAINVLDYCSESGSFKPILLNYYEHVKDNVILRGAAGDGSDVLATTNSGGESASDATAEANGALATSITSNENPTASKFLASSPASTTPDNNATTTTINYHTIMREVDYVANRVALCTLSGFFGGAAYATFRGYPRRSTSLKIAGSCAIVATSLFASERLANVALRASGMIPPQDDTRLTLSSYAFGGIVGGGLNGYLYQKQPARGMLVFLPVMLCVAGLELDWKRQKAERAAQVQQAMKEQE